MLPISPAALVAILLLGSTAGAQSATLVSANSSGSQGDADSRSYSSLSANGRYVAFYSQASNLVANDTNGASDAFVRDRLTGQTTRVSLSTTGAQANGPSGPCCSISISADGRLVAFNSYASNLVPTDTNSTWDVFVYDLATGETTRASVSTQGIEGNNQSFNLALSDDGRFVAFDSFASNLVTGDTNATSDVFVRDLQASETRRVSVSSSGLQLANSSNNPSISSDGRIVAYQSGPPNSYQVYVFDTVAGQTSVASVSPSGALGNGPSFSPAVSASGFAVVFSSNAQNLAAADSGPGLDVFLRDLQSGSTTLVSVGSNGLQGNGFSSTSNLKAISADDRFVVFYSGASDLLPGDTNGAWDVFLYDRQLGTSSLISVGVAGASADDHSAGPTISSHGNVVSFFSEASNLVSGDTNDAEDVFAVTLYTACYLDNDHDGYGAGLPVGSVQVCGAGFSTNDLDCDDTNPQINPVTAELCNGVDDDCDGQIDEGLPLTRYFLDSDGDGYGWLPDSALSCTPLAGYVLNSLDCNDASALVHPAAPELCDGLDNDCDGITDEGFISTYCTAGTTVHGCVPTIAGVGTPSSQSASGFDIVVRNTPGQRFGTIFYGFYAGAVPWAPFSPSFQCIAFPIQRTGDRQSGGTAGQCNGELRLDFNAWRAANPGALGSPYVAGQVIYAQGWLRDPGAPKQTNLSDGLRFTLCD
jgi:Tol biopolymer transport system component